MAEKLGDPPQILGFDVETHDWIGGLNNELHIGDFGFFARMDRRELDYQRIVQIGYVFGDSSSVHTTAKQSMYVRPDGFTISEKAEGKHGKTQALVLAEGRPLTEVLEE